MKINYTISLILIISIYLVQILGYKLPSCKIEHSKLFGVTNQKLISIAASGIDHDSKYSDPSMITVDRRGKVGVFKNLWHGFDDQAQPSHLDLSSNFHYPIKKFAMKSNMWIYGEPILSSIAVTDGYGKEELYFKNSNKIIRPPKNCYSYISPEQFQMMGLVGGANSKSLNYWSVNFAYDNLYCMYNHAGSFLPIVKAWRSSGRMIGVSPIEKSDIIAIATENVLDKTFKVGLYQPQFKPQSTSINIKQVHVFDFGRNKIKYITFGSDAFGFAICDHGKLYVMQMHHSHNLSPQRIIPPNDPGYDTKDFKCLYVRYIYGDDRSAYIITLETCESSTQDDDHNSYRVVIYHITTEQKSNAFIIRAIQIRKVSSNENVVAFDVTRVPPPKGRNARNIYAVAAILSNNEEQTESQEQKHKCDCNRHKCRSDSHKSLIEHMKIEIDLHKI